MDANGSPVGLPEGKFDSASMVSPLKALYKRAYLNSNFKNGDWLTSRAGPNEPAEIMAEVTFKLSCANMLGFINKMKS